MAENYAVFGRRMKPTGKWSYLGTRKDLDRAEDYADKEERRPGSPYDVVVVICLEDYLPE